MVLHKLDKIPIVTTLEHVLKRLAVEETEDIAIITDLFEQAKVIARPKVLYREVFVEEINGSNVCIDGCTFTSDVLAMNLKNVHRVFAYVCTCGTEVDAWSHMEKDYVISLWLDMIKEMFLYEASVFLQDHIKNAFQITKLSSINPGSGDLENWPISQQAPLFSMIGDVKGEIGVTLKESFLMIPVKSTSGLLFPSENEFVNCALCRREKCPGRRVEFDQMLYNQTFMLASG